MTRIHEWIETRLAREAAFDYVADFSHQHEWDPGTVAARRIDGGPVGRGARFALQVRVGPRTAPMEYRITEWDPPNRVVLVGEGSGVRSVDDIRFTESGAGTAVDYLADIELQGPLGLLQPLMGGPIRRLGQRAAAGMRRELDALAAGGPGDRAGGSER